jgi:2-amino-4-hydroxy-6-hydroxymethyldihydropteridine diphosphokinase
MSPSVQSARGVPSLQGFVLSQFFSGADRWGCGAPLPLSAEGAVVPTVYIALGSNLGNRQANMAMALRMLPPLARVDAVSPLYESPPQPPAPAPPYLNAAARIVTGLGPELLLRHLKQIEHLIGRRSRDRWAPRPIDLDIALYDDLVLETADLSIPHPRIAQRAFVLKPLVDIDPELRHAGTGERLADLLVNMGAVELTQLAGSHWYAM